jgi:hypothetical protein
MGQAFVLAWGPAVVLQQPQNKEYAEECTRKECRLRGRRKAPSLPDKGTAAILVT